MSTSHLDFYIKHNISPVHYAAGSVQEHFDRRASLYRRLGVLPLAFRGSRVLEVAVGSGQNSLYVASLMPASLTLVEPNPTGIREIRDLYAKTEVPHTSPILVEATLQNYVPEHRFDVVLCENWLGRAPHERALLRKLGGFLEPQGILVITTQPPIGLLPNMMRRALAVKYCDPALPFAERTEGLVAMFGPHLATISAMTRSATDWVHDNMMNPAYFDLYLTIPDVLHELDGVVTATATNPSFGTDWRWFKSLYGDARQFNQHMVREYEGTLHNLFDYQLAPFPQPDVELNRELDRASVEFLEAVRAYDLATAANQGDTGTLAHVIATLGSVLRLIRDFPEPVRSGIEEGLRLLQADHQDPRKVAEAGAFGRLFGRETIFISVLAEPSGH